MKVLHVVPGLCDPANGIAVAAKRIAEAQRQQGHEVWLVETKEFSTAPNSFSRLTDPCPDEAWIHSMWLPRTLHACWKVLKSRASIGSPRLIRMTHGCLSPLTLKHQGKWKKRLIAPIERWLFSRTDRVVVTGEWEAEWCRRWGLTNEMQILDLRQYFDLKSKREVEERTDRALHVLYLGRRHPLKGVQYLEQAVAELNGEATSQSLQEEEGSTFDQAARKPLPHSVEAVAKPSSAGEARTPPLRRCGVSPHHDRGFATTSVELRIESSLFGEEKEEAWNWCDVFCLPTLSENFGLVVAEALEHGKLVITTDGAPAWEPGGESRNRESTSHFDSQIIYLRGYRDGADAERVKLLKEALMGACVKCYNMAR